MISWHNYRPNYFPLLQVALRIRPLKNDEKSRGYRCVAEKVDDRVRIRIYSTTELNSTTTCVLSLTLFVGGLVP